MNCGNHFGALRFTAAWASKQPGVERVARDGHDSTLQADRGVVLAAVAQNGLALWYASGALRADRDVVLAAVAKNGLALWYASGALKADRDAALVAVAQDGDAFEYACPRGHFGGGNRVHIHRFASVTYTDEMFAGGTSRRTKLCNIGANAYFYTGRPDSCWKECVKLLLLLLPGYPLNTESSPSSLRLQTRANSVRFQTRLPPKSARASCLFTGSKKQTTLFQNARRLKKKAALLKLRRQPPSSIAAAWSCNRLGV